VGKTSEREGVLLISSISGNYISAKIKPTEFNLSLPRFSCLKMTGRNPKQPPQILCSDSRTVRTVTAINVVRFSRKLCPEINAVVRRPYDLYGLINAAVCLVLHAALCPEQVQKTHPYQIHTVRIYISCWLPRNPCPAFVLEIVPLICCKPFFRKLETSLLLLSLNLSISLGKNDFSFGLFPPLESLSDF
jgi:hypothetical protein